MDSCSFKSWGGEDKQAPTTITFKCLSGFGYCQYCLQLLIGHSYLCCVLPTFTASSPPVWLWLSLRPAEIILLAWVPSSNFSPTLRSLIWSLCIPVIDPRQKAQMGPSGAKEQRQHPPVLRSMGWHSLLSAKCLLFPAVLLVNPSWCKTPESVGLHGLQLQNSCFHFDLWQNERDVFER